MKLWRQIRHQGKKSAQKDVGVASCSSSSPTLSIDSGQQSGADTRSQSPSDEGLGVTTVELHKKNGATLGIIIGGGVDKSQLCPSISSLRSGSVAQRSDALLPGDRITAVNGIRTSNLRHDELVNLLKNVEERAVLEIEYPLPQYPSESLLSVCSKVTQITLEREAGSLGFTLRGGVNHDPLLTRPLTITHVRPGGPADREGTIKSGDRLVGVEGTPLHSASLLDAQRILQQSQECRHCTLMLEYDVGVLESVRHATGPLLVEIERPPVRELGVTLADAEGRGGRAAGGCVVIEGIRPAGIADRCGALHVGDQILAVNDTRVEGSAMSAVEVSELLTSSSGGHLVLEILPLSQINCGWRISGNTARSRGFLGPPSASPSPSAFASLANRNRRNNRTNESSPTLLHHDSGSVGSGSFGCPGICHTETLHLTLQADHQGYGFTVAPSSNSDVPSIVITSIEPGGPADRCGRLQVGDRLLTVDRRPVSTSDEVASVLADARRNADEASRRLSVDVEFDVADSVVPSSGVFSVKLAKRGNGLGITVTASKNRLPGEPLLISDIRRGSVAHRTGSLQPGDRLLAINSLQIDQCSIQDTQNILHNSGDIVTLRVQKDDSFSDVSDSKSVVYTVELVRYGGPLGITLAGSEERFEPILISGLTSGGLAEQTGALHVGDRLLAINSESLRGKPLSAAVTLLHNCGDSVTMRIARNRPKPSSSPPGESPPFSPGLPSVDSAVESWDSQQLDASNNVSPDNNATPTTEVYKCESATVKRKQKITLLDSQLLSDSEQWGRHSTDSLDSGQSGVFSGDNKIINWSKPHNHAFDYQPNSRPSLSDGFSECSNGEPKDLHYASTDQTQGQEYLYEESSGAPSPLPLPPYLRNHTLPNRRRYSDDSQSTQDQAYYEDIYIGSQVEPRGMYNSTHCGSYVNLALSSDSNQHLELYQVTLFKDPIYEDFGFSVSDGLYERGVYINRVRKGGPADMSNTLKPYDRILQVNDTRTHDFDCCLTVPLIASAGEKLELTVARSSNTYPTFQDKDCNGSLPWVEEETTSGNHNPMITKTL